MPRRYRRGLLEFLAQARPPSLSLILPPLAPRFGPRGHESPTPLYRARYLRVGWGLRWRRPPAGAPPPRLFASNFGNRRAAPLTPRGSARGRPLPPRLPRRSKPL